MSVDTITKVSEKSNGTNNDFDTKPATIVIDDRNLSIKQKHLQNKSLAQPHAQSSVASIERPAKDNWDKITAVAPIISGMLIFVMGGLFTYTFNQQQLRIQEIQTIEKFIPHLMGNEQSKKAAILAMSQLTNPELAGKFAGIFASTGTVSALQSMVENGNAHEKNIATKALSDALESLAARENRLTAIQAEYQQKLQTKTTEEPAGDQDYMRNLSQLGEVYKLRGQATLAEPLLKKSLMAREKLYGTDNPQVADALRSLAEMYQMNGNSTEATNCLKRARAIEAKYTTTTKSETESTAPVVSHLTIMREPVPQNETEKMKSESAEKEKERQTANASSTPAETRAAAEEKRVRYIEASEEQKLKAE
jgi:tetratricopeptide (TPR) repeat protein